MILQVLEEMTKVQACKNRKGENKEKMEKEKICIYKNSHIVSANSN